MYTAPSVHSNTYVPEPGASVTTPSGEYQLVSEAARAPHTLYVPTDGTPATGAGLPGRVPRPSDPSIAASDYAEPQATVSRATGAEIAAAAAVAAMPRAMPTLSEDAVGPHTTVDMETTYYEVGL